MSHLLRLLIVADPETNLQPLLDELRRNDYLPEWERVETAVALRAALGRAAWDILLVSDRLRHFSASAALNLLQASGLDIPPLIITEAQAPDDLRAALSLGALDCIRLQSPARLTLAVEREVRAAKVRAARALTEAALREAEARYRQLVEQLPVGVHLMDLDAAGSTLSISPPLERILGYSLAEWVAEPGLWRRLIVPEDRERALAELARVFAPDAGAAIAEYRMLARHGREVWIRDESLLVRGADGRPHYVQSVKLEITARRRMEAEAARISDHLAQWVKELEQSNRELSLLDEMSRQLQGCETPAAAYPLIADFVQLLFPGISGALYCPAPAEPARLTLAAQWGRYPPVEPGLGLDDCLALRRRRPVLIEDPAAGPACAHLGPGSAGSLCLPLSAAGETLGLLHFRLRRDPAWPEAPRDLLTEAKQRLTGTVVERVTLALATLRREASLRERAPAEGEAAVIVVGPLQLDGRTFELLVGERRVKPTPVEFELLKFLMQHPGQVFTTEQLLQHVWGYPAGVGSHELVRAHVKNLRAKLEPDPRRPIYLRTKGRFGYTISPRPPAENAADD